MSESSFKRSNSLWTNHKKAIFCLSPTCFLLKLRSVNAVSCPILLGMDVIVLLSIDNWTIKNQKMWESSFKRSNSLWANCNMCLTQSKFLQVCQNPNPTGDRHYIPEIQINLRCCHIKGSNLSTIFVKEWHHVWRIRWWTSWWISWWITWRHRWGATG